MADRKSVVRNSLLKSSINIRSIRNSVSNFTEGFTGALETSSDIVEQTAEQNKFKEKLLFTDAAIFRKRQEAIRRKDREDEIEASTIGGAIKRTGTVAASSTRGILGRILDFVGIVFIGWMVGFLPKLIKGISTFMSNTGKLLSALKGFVVGTRDTLEDSNNQLSQVKQTIDDVNLAEDEQKIKKEFDETDSAYLKLTNNVIDSYGVFKNPKNFGWTEDSWEKVGNKSLGEDSGQGKDKKEDKKEDNKKPKIINQFEDKQISEKKEQPTKKEETNNKNNQQEQQQTSKQEEDDGFEFDPNIGRDESQPLVRRFENGYKPPEYITVTNKDGKKKSVYNEDYAKYLKWKKENIDNAMDMYLEGTSRVPEDGPAYLHKDEAVIPAESVKRVGVDFIERIIANKNNASVIDQKKAARSLYEKLTEQHIEEHGHITIDQDEEYKDQTIGRLKRELKGIRQEVQVAKQEVEDIKGKQTIDPSMMRDTPSAEEAFDNLPVEVVGNNNFSNIFSGVSNIRNRRSQEIASGRKKSKIIMIDSPPVSPSLMQQSQPMPMSSSDSSLPINISKSTEKSLTNKLQELELSYT
tara:strand:- start:545 stop:2284 length:1740 start_codon:yes stop_codon:yes gene_type:complete